MKIKRSASLATLSTERCLGQRKRLAVLHARARAPPTCPQMLCNFWFHVSLHLPAPIQCYHYGLEVSHWNTIRQLFGISTSCQCNCCLGQAGTRQARQGKAGCSERQLQLLSNSSGPKRVSFEVPRRALI